MSIISGSLISRYIADGSIRIWPFDPKQINPASYDVRLGKGVVKYDDAALGMQDIVDSRAENPVKRFDIPDCGIVIRPGNLYLMHTEETIYAQHFVPTIDGKSSIGRLGLGVHVTAGRGDPGFDGQYTLEVFSVAHSVRVYAGMKIGQVFFHTMVGHTRDYLVNGGHYVGPLAKGAQPSLSWKQFEEDKSR